MMASFGAFFAWWFGQLAGLLPAWLRRSAPTSADALVIAPAGQLADFDNVAVSIRRHGEEEPLGLFPPGASELTDLPRAPGRPIVLRLAKADLLEKRLVLPLAAESDLEQVLAFEMDRETPFEPAEVYWNHVVEAVDRRAAQLRVRLLLMPKVNLAPLLERLARSGIVPRWAEVEEGGGQRAYLPLDGDDGRPVDRSRRLLWPAALCCAVLAVGAAATPFIQQAIELAALDSQVRAAQSTAREAEALRGEIDRIARNGELVRGEANKAARPLEILAAVTRIVPDDTYLTEFELKERKLTISGRSAGAARLIGALAADGTFRDPAFAAPVTRLESLHAEVFTIVTNVGPQP